MDILKQELAKQRQSLSEATGGRKFFKRSEIEQKRLQKLREEEKQELDAKQALHHNQSSSSTTNSSLSSLNNNLTLNSSSNPNSSQPVSTSSVSKTRTDEQKIDDLDLPKQEVVRRLRFLKQPITLFGEDDAMRLDRLKFVLKTGTFEVDSDMTEGQTNDFLRDIEELRKRQKSGDMREMKKRKGNEDGPDGVGGGDREDDLMGDEGLSAADIEHDQKRMKANFEDLCDEDKILVFFKKLLTEWSQELIELENTERRTAKGKAMVAKFKQCARYLHPLFKFCRKKVSNE